MTNDRRRVSVTRCVMIIALPLPAHKLPVSEQARTALRRLAAKLDALSHYSFAPRPVVEDMAIRADVPALAMEDVAPQVRHDHCSWSFLSPLWAVRSDPRISCYLRMCMLTHV